MLFSLPVDLLVEHILSRLSLMSLTVCLSVCRQLHTIIASSTHLNYIVELEKEGMIDNPCCSYEIYPRSKRLEMLKERAMRWKHLDLKWRARVRWPKSNRSNFDTYNITPSPQMLVLPTLRGVEGRIVEEAYFARLPVTLADIAAKWDKITLGKHILAVGMAIEEHDLLAFATSMPSPPNSPEKFVQIHLLRRSTREPHPLASSPILDICTVRSTELTASHVRISGENLTFTITYKDDTGQSLHFLNIWNWKAGCVKANLKRSFHGGVLFLREDLLLIPNVVQSLLLPRLAERAHIEYLSSFTNSNPISSPSIFLPHTDPLRPFVNDPLSEVLAFTLGVSFQTSPLEEFTFVTQHLILLTQAAGALASFSGPGAKPRTPGQEGEHGLFFPSSKSIPWESWGPQATRWFPHNLSHNSMDDIRSASGTRCLSGRIEFDFQNHFEVVRLQVLNFGVPSLLPSSSSNRKDSSLTSKAFTKPVISYLPCVVTDLPWKMGERNDVDQNAPLDLNAARLDWNAVCMTDERIICNLKNKSGFEVLYFG
ncbi:hypothetical protein BDZ97DRAFT_527309 [Flammula alnicola]|nr:hypothetical protein BDZ97DRAFT_527309 [Flammula alnicola]